MSVGPEISQLRAEYDEHGFVVARGLLDRSLVENCLDELKAFLADQAAKMARAPSDDLDALIRSMRAKNDSAQGSRTLRTKLSRSRPCSTYPPRAARLLVPGLHTGVDSPRWLRSARGPLSRDCRAPSDVQGFREARRFRNPATQRLGVGPNFPAIEMIAAHCDAYSC